MVPHFTSRGGIGIFIGYRTNTMDAITLMLAKSAGKLLLKIGKAGVVRLLTEPLLHQAATDTQLEFERLEIRESLMKWSAGQDMAQLLEDLRDGKRDDVSTLVPGFVKETGFDDGDSTETSARTVIGAFLEHVLNRLLRSPDGLTYVANRAEVIHSETKDHVSKQADRVIQHVETTVTSSKVDHQKKLETEFNYQTTVAQKNIRVEIVGLDGSVERSEVSFIEAQFRLGIPVMLNGDPGTGKTGVALFVSRDGAAAGKQVLYIDARRLQDVQNEADLRHFYSIDEPLSHAIQCFSSNGFRLIIDQFDNAANRKVGNVLVELANECSELPGGVEVLVVSRSREGHESELVRRLTDGKFVTITCRPLAEEESSALLNRLEIEQPTQELIELCRNLLNLDIVATIKKEQPTFEFSNILNEVLLWESYFEILVRRESESSTRTEAEQILDEAMALARFALQSGQQAFVIDQVTPKHRRLVSWGVIVNVEGNIHQFGHEILQDFLYARYAANRGIKPKQVLAEVGALKSRSILSWIARIYSSRGSSQLATFLEEMLNA
jgi:hypothetical protein